MGVLKTGREGQEFNFELVNHELSIKETNGKAE